MVHGNRLVAHLTQIVSAQYQVYNSIFRIHQLATMPHNLNDKILLHISIPNKCKLSIGV